VIDAILGGLALFARTDALIAIMIAVPIGLVFGVLPGLSGLTTLAILIPFIYGMEPFVGLAFVIAAHAVTTTSGAIPSILIGIPGTPPSAATVIDGFPLSQKGRGGYACGAALMASAVGGVMGCIIMAILLPVLQPIILSFGAPETFMLILIGLLFLASVGSQSIWKGLIAGVFGIFLSFVGYEAISGVPRFWLGYEYFLDGFRLVPLALSTAVEKPATGRREGLPLVHPGLMSRLGARLGTRAPRVAGVCQGALA
jgi:putative tricarboxylic transport membrane protein